jgi:hypothetical protein
MKTIRVPPIQIPENTQETEGDGSTTRLLSQKDGS